MNILSVNKVSYRYSDAAKDEYVLKDVDMNFELGKSYAIKGKSGSGKTTLLSLISGLEKKYEGNRPLAVFVNWFVTDDKLDCDICFDNPLCLGGKDSYNNLENALNLLKISTTNDINKLLVVDNSKIYE